MNQIGNVNRNYKKKIKRNGNEKNTGYNNWKIDKTHV